MSFKAKDLQFERQEPAFLRRFKAGIADATDDPDRQINPLPLPKKPKRLQNEDDDGPTYVVEGSNETLTKDEYEKLVKKSMDDGNGETPSKSEEQDDTKDAGSGPDPTRPKQQSVQARHIPKKRKAVKVIGENETSGSEKPAVVSTTKKSNATKPKKKAKVKLSFDEGEG
jgi:hypothetical protein